MAVDRYRISLLELEDCPLRIRPDQLLRLLRAWRKRHVFGHVCLECEKKISFESMSYAVCCQQFYYNDRLACYQVVPIAIPTPGYVFMLPQLQRMIEQARLETRQDFLVIPDPIYWQVPTTLVYEKVVKFVSGVPMTHRTKLIQPASKAPLFYKQVQEAPLNYGSLESRSCGKATLIRQVAFGKRCRYSMRGMIVPDASLRPNEIRLPDHIVDKFELAGKWIILNRMPSLQPENFVGLQVPTDGPSWPYDCFGIPLEILESINGDFDGDEANVYLVPSLLSQAECLTILNPEWEMRSFVMGLKLAPSQDMLVAYYMFYDDIDFLPYKDRNLKKTMRFICEKYGDSRAFHAFNQMRLFYLDRLQNHTCFALTLAEMQTIAANLKEGKDIQSIQGCLTTQILAKAKGNFETLTQMFGCIGMQSGVFIKNSFMSGLHGVEASAHGKTSIYALNLVLNIWLPGYGYQKLISNAHDMIVNYEGNIVDGDKRIIFQNALDGYHHEDIISESLFMHIFESFFGKNET